MPSKPDTPAEPVSKSPPVQEKMSADSSIASSAKSGMSDSTAKFRELEKIFKSYRQQSEKRDRNAADRLQQMERQFSRIEEVDNRGLFVDLDMNFLQGPAEKISKSASRGLYTGNPELVEVYNATVRKYYQDHRMMERINDLYDNFKNMSRSDIRKKLISLDNDQGRAMMLGEKKLSRSEKPFQWSPELRNLAFLRLCWKLRMREVLQGADYSNTFSRWQDNIRTMDSTFSFPHPSERLTIDDIRSKLNSASKRFRDCQKNAESSRTKCYDDLLEKYENDNNPATKSESTRKAHIVRCTIDGEVTRNKFRDIRRIIKPVTVSSLSMILVPRMPDNPDPSSAKEA